VFSTCNAHISQFAKIVVQSIYTSPNSTESASPPPVVTAESPELYALQLSYPPEEEPADSRFLDRKIPKFESFADDFSLAGGSHLNAEVEPFASPVDSAVTSSSDSSSTSAFPLFSGTGEMAELPWSAGADFKPDLENFNVPYQVAEANGHPAFIDGHSLEFSIYDNYGFHTIPDDTLANLADHYI